MAENNEVPGPASQRVWDPLVRVLHWSLVVSVLLAWVTREGGGHWHEWAGYAALGVVALRFVWGWIGSARARFAGFVRGPSVTFSYARQVLAHREARHLGHNPLGGWMVVALLADVALTGLSGWLYTTDAYWGVKWVEEMHGAFANALLPLVALHVAGVIVTSQRHRENLVTAMIHGRKRPPSGRDVI